MANKKRWSYHGELKGENVVTKRAIRENEGGNSIKDQNECIIGFECVAHLTHALLDA